MKLLMPAPKTPSKQLPREGQSVFNMLLLQASERQYSLS